MLFASRFKLIKRLDGGNLSQVWLAIDFNTVNNDLVALKILGGNDNSLLKEFFSRETEALSELNHTNIVRIIDSGFDHQDKKYWICLEYIEGRTLEDRLKDWHPDIRTALDMMLEITDAIVAAHSKDIIHRDLKPLNIMCDHTGMTKVLDFGISKLKSRIQAGLTVRGFGSPPYTAPEQLQDEEIDSRADIYSLGAIFFRIFSGKPLLDKELLLDQVRRSSLENKYKHLLEEMVGVEPNSRFSSVLQMKRELLKLNTNEIIRTTTYYIKLTQKMIDSMLSLGIIDNYADSEALGWLTSEFNSTSVFIEKGKYETDWFIYCQKYRIIASKDANTECLILKQISLLLPTDILRNKEWAFQPQASWIILPRHGFPPQDADIQDLFEQVLNFKKKLEVRKSREVQQKKTVVQWENVLRLQKRYLEEKYIGYEYKSWDISEDGSMIDVNLSETIPLPHLLQNQPMLMTRVNDDSKGKKGDKQISIGDVYSAEGKLLKVALARGINVHDIAESGEITLNNRQVATALKRQEDAIRATRYGEAKNPRLLQLIENPDISDQTADTMMLDYFQQDLDDAKKEAVKAVLRSELYLIQGPPGTGKTKVISEIIAQLYKGNPNIRIMLTSQSNAAVDNALLATSKLIPACSFLRIGREGKVDSKLAGYELEGTLKKWVNKTRENSNKAARTLIGVNRQKLDELGEYGVLTKEIRVKLDEYNEVNKDYSNVLYRLYEAKCEHRIEEVHVLETTSKRYKYEIKKIWEDIGSGVELLSEYLNVTFDTQREPEESLNIYLLLVEAELEKKRKSLNHFEQIEVIRQEWLNRLGKGKDFEAICATETKVVASTCLGVSNIPGVWASTYDWIIVDEAGRATPPEILVPLVRGKRILLVGDHRQLPPVVEMDLTNKDLENFDIDPKMLEISLFEEIFNRANEKFKKILNVQYRMHTGIGSLISKVFYDSTILNSPLTTELNHSLSMWQGKSVVWVSTSFQQERYETQEGTSRLNKLEAKQIVQYCNHLKNMANETNRELTLAIISGYSEQKKLLEQLLNPKEITKWGYLQIEINNVDAFQGQERDIVIYSVVRSNTRRDIGFLKDFRRLNVALSRARRLLVIIGDHEMVQNAYTGDKMNAFAEVILHIKKTDKANCLLEVL